MELIATSLPHFAGRFMMILADAQGAEAARHLADMHTQPWFWEVLAAAVVGWILGIVKGFAGTKDWLKRYWTTSPVVLTFSLDVLLFVLVGAYFGTGIYDPDNFLEAIAAGISWPVGVGALATRDVG